MTSISRRTTGRLFCCWTMPEKWIFRNGHCHGMQGADRTWCQKDISGPGKAALHGSVGRDRRNHGTACSPGTTGEYREAVDMLEGITALMTGYNEVHDIIPTI